MAGVGRLVGATGKWTKQALLAFLEDLRPKLSDLDEREQYEILQQGGQMPALRAVLGGASPMAVLRDLSGGGTVIEHALKESSRLEVSDELLDEDSIAQAGDPSSGVEEAVSAEARLAAESPTDAGTRSLPDLITPEGLRVVDTWADTRYSLDDEAAEFMVMNRVNRLWTYYFRRGRASAESRLVGDGGRWFTEIKRRFLDEVADVDRLAIPRGWSYEVDGDPAQPNLMQRRAAWQVRERRRVGNWSGVGTGKTLSAVLASRVSRAHATLKRFS